jgi:hypothetical protein
MNVKIYQSYYDKSQLSQISPVFIPFDNTENKEPDLREYPLLKKLYETNKNTDSHWGLLSWRWFEKTHLPEIEFYDWIIDNTGYDVYHFDPFLDVTVNHNNLWTQGDLWRPGMSNFCNRLLPRLGINKTVDELVYGVEDFGTCSFYIANSNYWTSLLNFIEHCIQIIKSDSEMNHYMFELRQPYNGVAVLQFSFVIERFFSLHNYINKGKFKILQFPFEHECYRKMYGDNHTNLLNSYKEKMK